MTYSPLSDLNNSSEDWLIRVRVCRVWECINAKDGNLMAVDMILADEKGNLVHASLRKHLMTRFEGRVREGMLCSIRNLKVTTNTYPYRPLASDAKLLFLATTVVQELDESVVPILRYGFQFVDHAVLQSRADDPTILSDVVGCYAGFGRVEVVGDGYKKRDIKIFTDYSVYSTITLWGKLGEMFDPAQYPQNGGPYVIVVSSVKVKTYQGSLSFSTTSGSRVYVNPELEHVSSIRDRFSSLSIKVEASEPSVPVLPPEKQMFINRMTVDALVNATGAGELKVGTVALKATITAINGENGGYGWYYISCKSCVRKVVPVDGVFVCNACQKTVDYPLALYRINVQVQDTTGTTTLVLFNSSAERLLDTSAKKLINQMPPGQNTVPPELQALLGKELVFKLKLNKYNLVEGLQDYGVSAVYTLIKELETSYELAEAAGAQLGSQLGSEPPGNVDPGSHSGMKRKLSAAVPDGSEEA